MIREGKSLEEIQKTIYMKDLRTGVWDINDDVREGFDLNITILVERIWRGIRGQG